MTVKGKKTDPKEVKNYRLLIAKDGAISIYDGESKVVAAPPEKRQVGCICLPHPPASAELFAGEYY